MDMGAGMRGGGGGGAMEQAISQLQPKQGRVCVGAKRELRGITASGTFTHVVQDGGNR